MDTAHLPKDFSERVCQLAQIVALAFERDLKEVDKLILKKLSMDAKSMHRILELVFYDNESQCGSPLFDRSKIRMILESYARYLESVKDFKCHTINDSGGKLITYLHFAKIDQSMKLHAKSIYQRQDYPIVIVITNKYGMKNCLYMLSFDSPVIPIGEYQSLV